MKTKTRNPEEIRDELLNYHGTASYTRHPLGLLLTDGAAYLAKAAGAYWLMDVIASHQPAIRRHPEAARLGEFQLWQLELFPGGGAVATCRADSDEVPAITQEIEWTDFPLPEGARLFVCPASTGDPVAMLPGEY